MSEQKPTIQLTILTPDQIVVDEPVAAVRFQQPDGWMGILPNHAPYITQLVNGILAYRRLDEETQHYIVLYGGTLQVSKNTVMVLTTVAEVGDDLQALARKLLSRQAEADALAFDANIEFTKVRTALVRALTGLPEPLELIK